MSEYQKTRHTNLRRCLSNGGYVMFVRIKGKLHCERLDTVDEEVALQRRDKRTAELRASAGARPAAGDSPTSFRQLMQAWIDGMETSTPVELTRKYNVSLAR